MKPRPSSATTETTVDTHTHTRDAYLRELVSHHVADPPGLVLGSLAQGGHHQGLQVLLGQQGGDAHARLHRQQTHRVLETAGEGGNTAPVVTCINGTSRVLATGGTTGGSISNDT